MSAYFLFRKTGALFLGLCLFLFSCQETENQEVKLEKPPKPEAQLSDVPDWAKEAVWYQIFPERFRNGDSTNDPRPQDIQHTYPGFTPDAWSVTPWEQDWYKPDVWFAEADLPNFGNRLQLRRYGGDLQGVLDRLDYLKELGINAIFFNPLNDSPSLHKYDSRYWRHIDRNFGPDPDGDAKIMEAETGIDPATWKFTAADRLFLEVIKACHERGIRLIMDYSWNHTGMDSWALNDIRKNGKASKMYNWYEIHELDNPATEADEFSYDGWIGIKYLPEIKRFTETDDELAMEGNFSDSTVIRHIFNVSQRWLDPNGDGDPSDGIDGFRLDVAAEIPMGFWRDYRKFVRSVNPEAYLVGELWWENWPDELLNPAPFLQGDMFDASMNYRWYRPARQFFADAPVAISPSAFADSLKIMTSGLRPEVLQGMMNLTASHDSPRTSTSLFNPGKYKYQVNTNENPAYRIDRPDAETGARQRMLAAHQFTFIGSPHIWYGDEIGMWGDDDPSCRKPMVWDDIVYEDETGYPQKSGSRKPDKVLQDKDLLQFYSRLAHIRTENKVLSYGAIEYIFTDDMNGLFAYSRYDENAEILVVFNKAEKEQNVILPVKKEGRFKDAFSNEVLSSAAGTLPVKIGPMNFRILIRE